MSPPHEELARRLVASPRWRWMSGMLVRHPDDAGRLLAVRGPRVTVSWDEELAGCEWDPATLLPDLTDPATVGCLRSLVELGGRVVAPRLGDAFGGACWWRLDLMMARPHEGLVTSPVMYEGRYIGGLTLLDALVDALLHAPEVTP